jgi:hypothetical protein
LPPFCIVKTGRKLQNVSNTLLRILAGIVFSSLRVVIGIKGLAHIAAKRSQKLNFTASDDFFELMVCRGVRAKIIKVTHKSFAGFVVTRGVLVCIERVWSFVVDVFQIQPAI